MTLPARRIAYLFPGQGAQYPEMGADFASRYPIAKQTFEEADDLLQRALSKEIFQGSRETLKETCTSQPALYVVSIAIWRVLRQLFPDISPYACAGLSLGEYSALTASGILPFEQGIHLVSTRAQAMHQACLEHPGGMAAVTGLDIAAVQEVLDQLSPAMPICIANLNCPGQVVISGSQEALTKIRPLLEQKGAKRCLLLEVAGAFHSSLMQSAKDALHLPITECRFAAPLSRLVMNVPGDFVEEQAVLRRHLINQVTHPVLWEQGVRKMDSEGITHYVEIGPGKTLSGMNKRILPHATTLNVGVIEDLSGMESFYER